MISYGQVAYEEYRDSLIKQGTTESKVETWDELHETEREAWETAAQKIVRIMGG